MPNRYRPHLLILPEDDANRQIAIGFHLSVPSRQIDILDVAGGWTRVRDSFGGANPHGMESTPTRYLIALVDFDGKENRHQEVMKAVSQNLKDRIFMFGSKSEPEDLKQSGLGSFEEIGKAIARDCRDGTETTWAHALLAHNKSEVGRLRASACSAVFGHQ